MYHSCNVLRKEWLIWGEYRDMQGTFREVGQKEAESKESFSKEEVKCVSAASWWSEKIVDVLITLSMLASNRDLDGCWYWERRGNDDIYFANAQALERLLTSREAKQCPSFPYSKNQNLSEIKCTETNRGNKHFSILYTCMHVYIHFCICFYFSIELYKTQSFDSFTYSDINTAIKIQGKIPKWLPEIFYEKNLPKRKVIKKIIVKK